MNKSNKKSSKIFSIVCMVLTVIICVIAAAIVLNMVICRVKNKPVSFFGRSFAIVQTGSMEPEIMTGDLIVYRTCDYDDVQTGDYIVFVAGKGFGELQGQSVVHEAIAITENGIRTKGVNNAIADKDLVTEGNLLGICTSHSAGWGKVFSFLGKYGVIVIIALIAVPVIITQIIKIVVYSKQREKEKATQKAGNDETPDGAVEGDSAAENVGDTPPENAGEEDLVAQNDDGITPDKSD